MEYTDPPAGRWWMETLEAERYFAEVAAAKEQYADRITIHCGLEMDALCPCNKDGLDYCIGSVHVLATDAGHFNVDHSPAERDLCIERAFAGDRMAFAKRYYDDVVKMAKTLRPDIIGHFDLITKFSEDGVFFAEDHAAYRKLALDALDAVLATGAIIEVNTGAISRGYRKTPYPRPFLLEHILEKRGNIVLSSDTHAVATINFGFDESEAMLREIGFAETMMLTDAGFVPIPL